MLFRAANWKCETCPHTRTQAHTHANSCNSVAPEIAFKRAPAWAGVTPGVEAHRLPRDSCPPRHVLVAGASDVFLDGDKPCVGLCDTAVTHGEPGASSPRRATALCLRGHRGGESDCFCTAGHRHKTCKKILSLMLLFHFRNTRMKAKPGSTDR